MNNNLIQFRVDKNLYDELDRIAKAQGISVSLFARKTLEKMAIESLPLPDEDPFCRLEKKIDDLTMMLTNVREDFNSHIERRDQVKLNDLPEDEGHWEGNCFLIKVAEFPSDE